MTHHVHHAESTTSLTWYFCVTSVTVAGIRAAWNPPSSTSRTVTGTALSANRSVDHHLSHSFFSFLLSRPPLSFLLSRPSISSYLVLPLTVTLCLYYNFQFMTISHKCYLSMVSGFIASLCPKFKYHSKGASWKDRLVKAFFKVCHWFVAECMQTNSRV